MPKINEIVEIYTGYASTVDLKLEFLDPEKNRGRITQYVPIKPHRDSFEKIAHSVLPKDRRCYYLTGNYGTGKSHLCLMVANYFHNKSDTPELEGFFKNYGKVDENKAKQLQSMRKTGRYLVAICDFATKDDFEEVVLRAVIEACKREDVDIFPDTHYSESLRRLDKWEKESKEGTKFDKFKVFLNELQNRYSEYTIIKLKKGLQDYREESMGIFKDIFQAIIGTSFTFDKNNLNEILKDLLSNQKFKDRYEGLLILYDEFSYALKDGRVSFPIFQGFAQICTQIPTGCKPVIFLCTGHKPLEYYIKTRNKDDVGVVKDRVDEISLTPEEMEKIISSIIIPKKNHELWKKHVQANTSLFNIFLEDCKRMKLFPTRAAPDIRKEIIEDLYPMHPMATYALLKLAVEVGSNNRSAFKFFGGEESWEIEGSYPWFVRNTEILNEKKTLNLYTPDLLSLYFKDSLTSDNKEIREAVRAEIMNYETSVRELKKVGDKLLDSDQLAEKILKIMLVYSIIGIKNTVSNISFGLYAKTEPERENIKNRVNALADHQILYYNKVADVYELRRSGSVNFDSLIEMYKKDENNIPSDIINEFEEAVPFEKEEIYLIANRYNMSYNEDKRLKRIYALPSQIETQAKELDYFANLEKQIIDEKNWKESYEGFAVYVICENFDQISRMKKAIKQNKSDRIIISISNEPIPIIDALMDYKAVKSIQTSREYETYSTQDKARLMELIGNPNKGYTGKLYEIRTKYIEERNSIWYGKDGIVLGDKIKSLSEPADKLMNNLYTNRNKITHYDFNICHPKKTLDKNIPLSDAINKILTSKGEIKIDTSYAADKGQIRYLKEILARHDVLKQTRPHQGNIYFYQFETDPNKFKDTFPALNDMLVQVKAVEKNNLKCINMIQTFISPSYGLGPYSISLFLTCVFKILGDNIRLKKDETTIGYTTITDFNIIRDLIGNKLPNAFLVYKEITAEQKEFLNALFDISSKKPRKETEDKSTLEIYTALITWWDSLSEINKANIYDKKKQPNIKKFLSVFSNISQCDPYSFLFNDLQTIYGYDPDDLLTKQIKEDILPKFKSDKDIIDGGYSQIKEKIFNGIREIFKIEGKTDQDIQTAIRQWYNNLDTNQQDPHATWHINESKTLSQHLKNIINIEETLLTYVPEDTGFGLGQVKEWAIDQTLDYISKLKLGKKHIEENKIKVKEPTWNIDCAQKIKEEKSPDGIIVTYRKSAKLIVTSPEKQVKVYVTNNGENPALQSSQREEINTTEEFNIKGENLVFKMVSRDKEGNYSRLVEVSFINEDQKHTIQLPLFEGKDTTVQFIFPKDEESLLISAKSLIKSSLEKNIVDKKAIIRILKELLREYNG